MDQYAEHIDDKALYLHLPVQGRNKPQDSEQASLALTEAIQAYVKILEGEPAWALLYQPQRCFFGLCDTDGTVKDSKGDRIDLQAVLEARLFNPVAELRWLKAPGAQSSHKTVILADADYSDRLGAGWQVQVKPVLDILQQTYLLWGEGTGQAISDRWSQLATARIGSLEVPVPAVGKNQRVLLYTREYLVEADDGNVIVLDERLYKLQREDQSD